MNSHYEYFEHTADIGMRVHADSLEELLATAVRGLMDLMVSETAAIELTQTHTVELTATDPALWLFDLLSEVLFLFDVHALVFREVRVERLSVDRLRVELRGGPFEPDRHASGPEVKAVTYHQLSLESRGDQWHAKLIFDI